MTPADYAKQILMTDCRAPVPVEKQLEYLEESVKGIIADERERCVGAVEKEAARIPTATLRRILNDITPKK